MDQILDIAAVCSAVVKGYVTRSMNARLYYVYNEELQIASVIVIPRMKNADPHVMLMTRIDGDKVIIEADTTDRPLDEALVRAGIPRDRILFAIELEHASST